MKSNLLTLLRKTKLVTVPNGVVRALDDSELLAVVGGMMHLHLRSVTYAGGYPSDNAD